MFIMIPSAQTAGVKNIYLVNIVSHVCVYKNQSAQATFWSILCGVIWLNAQMKIF